MKILCQEHYDKVVKYAKEIGDTSLDNCLKKLEQWENNPNCPCEIELYRDFAPHSFGFRECYPAGKTGIVGGLIYHGNPDCRIPFCWNRFMDGASTPDTHQNTLL